MTKSEDEYEGRNEEDRTPPPSYTEVVTKGKDDMEMKQIEKKKEKGDKEKDKDDKKSDEEEEAREPPVGLIELFKFCTPFEAFLVIFGLTLSFSLGSAMPVMTIMFGQTLQGMQ